MKIAVDAMGGDYAPEQIVFGSVRAAKEYGCEIVLVGDEGKIMQVLSKVRDWQRLGISVLHASQVIEMGEHPVVSVRKKKDSSVVVATHLGKYRKSCEYQHHHKSQNLWNEAVKTILRFN